MVNWTNVTNAGDILAVANTNTGGFFWTAVVYLTWLVILLGLIQYGAGVAILTSSFIGIIISMFLVYAGLMAWEGALFFIGLLIFYILYSMWSSGTDK